MLCRRLVSFAVGALVALTAFAGPTNAAADVRATLRMCGARECATVKTTLMRLPPLLIEGPGSSPLPPPAATFYVLKFSVEGAQRVQKGWYVPSSHTTRWLVRAPSEWTKLSRHGAPFMQQHTAGRTTAPRSSAGAGRYGASARARHSALCARVRSFPRSAGPASKRPLDHHSSGVARGHPVAARARRGVRACIAPHSRSPGVAGFVSRSHSRG